MNNKVKLFVACAATMATVVLSGCGGCGGTASTKHNTLTRSNWYTGTSYNGIQPSFIVTEDNKKFADYVEKIVYDVSFDDADAKNQNFSVQYRNGNLTTLFFATEYDWAKDRPDGYSAEGKGKEIVYCYRAEFNIEVRFAMKIGDKSESEWFSDSVVTECYFRPAGKNLQPVYSEQSIKSTSPAIYQPTALEQAYKKIDVVYKNYYDYDCTRVFTQTTQDGKTENDKSKNLSGTANTLFDNSSLYIAARSMNLPPDASQTVSLYSPAAGGADSYAFTGVLEALSVQERADFTQKLEDKGLYKRASENDEGVVTSAVSISFAGGNLRGSSQTIWYAAVTNNDDNVSRSTMLKLSIPVSFNLGTLNYTLKEIISTLWNG